MELKCNGKTLANKVKVYSSLLFKGKGLMFSRFNNFDALLFKFEKEKFITIHTFFVFFPIDVVWLNKNYEVVDIKKDIKPFTLFIRPKNKAKYLIEFPAGKIVEVKESSQIVFP